MHCINCARPIQISFSLFDLKSPLQAFAGLSKCRACELEPLSPASPLSWSLFAKAGNVFLFDPRCDETPLSRSGPFSRSGRHRFYYRCRLSLIGGDFHRLSDKSRPPRSRTCFRFVPDRVDAPVIAGHRTIYRNPFDGYKHMTLKPMLWLFRPLVREGRSRFPDETAVN